MGYDIQHNRNVLETLKNDLAGKGYSRDAIDIFAMGFHYDCFVSSVVEARGALNSDSSSDVQIYRRKYAVSCDRCYDGLDILGIPLEE